MKVNETNTNVTGDISVIVAAAGCGRRLGKEQNKILLDLMGKPVLGYCLELFAAQPRVRELIVASASGEEEFCRSICKEFCGEKTWKIVTGGKERMDSVALCLDSVSEQSDYVMVHDGARPFLDQPTLERLLEADFTDGAILAVTVKETVKETIAGAPAGENENGEVRRIIRRTVPRENLYSAQTPQLFPRNILQEAYRRGCEEGILATDEAALVEHFGGKVTIVPGSEGNMKITTIEDWNEATRRVGKRRWHMRIGSGFDVHAFVEGRPLMLGGVEVPYELGLDGHSDADVAVHALMDAMLGALALGDIGQHFPPTDEAYRNADSMLLLKHVNELIQSRQYHLVNADLTIMAQKPKLMPYIIPMRRRIAEVLGVDEDQISVKATTTEKLGFVGREEGIAAEAVVLLEYDSV